MPSAYDNDKINDISVKPMKLDILAERIEDDELVINARIKIKSLVKKFAVKVNIDDTTSALFEFNNNCTGNLTTIFACPFTITFNIFGTNMNIFSDVDKNKIKIVNKNGKTQNLNLSNKDTLFLELQEFADSCKNKKKYRIKNSEAAHNVKDMDAIVKSSKKNKKVFL